MKIIINRTGHKISLPNLEHTVDAFEVIKAHGYERVNALDVENREAVRWEGIEFNRLFIKNRVLYRFNHWLGEHPYKTVEIEEIGRVKEN